MFGPSPCCENLKNDITCLDVKHQASATISVSKGNFKSTPFLSCKSFKSNYEELLNGFAIYEAKFI